MKDYQSSLYRPEFEKDNCGFGLIAQLDNQASHRLVQTAVHALVRLTHRGAVAADGKTGDGCGLLFKKPDEFLRAAAYELHIELNQDYASGLIFLPPDEQASQYAKQTLTQALAEQNLSVAGWRLPPLDPQACGEQALR